MDDKIKVILDTDMGTDIDDALALAYLLMQPRCELLGITTLTGEAKKRASLVSALLIAAGREDIPIYPGAEDCILIEQKEKYVPQAAILDSWPHRTDFPENEALSFMQRTIRENPHEVVLLGISPMSNIARLLLMDPELPKLLKGIYLMCGKFSEYRQQNWFNIGGEEPFCAFDPPNIMNILAGGSLEMNALMDPYATAIMYDLSKDCPVHRSVGYDQTHRVTLPMQEFIERCSHPRFKSVLDMAGVWFKTRDYVSFHDPLAAACVFNDDICEFTRGKVEIELASKQLMGYTYFTATADGPHEVASDVDPEKFFDEYFSVFK